MEYYYMDITSPLSCNLLNAFLPFKKTQGNPDSAKLKQICFKTHEVLIGITPFKIDLTDSEVKK